MNRYEQIISACGFSEEMERYLIGCKHNDYEMIEIILGAPLTLTEKRKLLELLNTQDSEGYDDVAECIREFDDALAALELKDGEIFTLSEYWYDDDILDENRSFAEPFLSFQAAAEYIKKLIEEETEDLDDIDEYVCWTEITKWLPVGDGKMKDVYSYTFVGNEIHYFKRIGNIPRDSYRGYKSSLDLNLPIPFKPGDIVTLNCLPFRPVKQAVLLEVDNRDCCGVQMLYPRKNKITGDTILETGALKHGDGWEGYFPMLSSLYRLSKYEGELSGEERILKDVQKLIYQNEETGRKLWKYILKTAPDKEELLKYLEKEYKDGRS
ncbi:MAG: hypothetical protein U0K87_13755 [Ruminococcus sp.]|nr:hypothetical protein [Ruminococcus sp.]